MQFKHLSHLESELKNCENVFKNLRMKSLLLEMSEIVGDNKLIGPQSAFLPRLLS